jgi:ribosome maturation factor RimP
MDGPLGDLVGQCVSELGLDLEALDLSKAGAKRVLRVAVDSDDGVSIDTIVETSRELSRALDATDVMGSQPYTLEVTSRGVDRPLTLPRHWRRNVGRLAKIRLHDDSKLTGRITAAHDDSVEVVVDGTPRLLPLADVVTARVEVELKPPTTKDV